MVYFATIKISRFLSISLILMITASIIGYYYFYGNDDGVTEAVAWSVANKIIVVDAGHGGIDPGAIGPTGILEKDINLAIAKRLALIFRQAGATVVMTREGDDCFSRRKREDLDARIGLAKSHKAEVFLSIQANALQSSRWTGAQTFYHPSSKESEELARSIQREMSRVLQNTKRKSLPHRDAYILKQLEIPTVVVEVGFMSNPMEERLMSDPFYQGKVAWSIYAGVVKYYAQEKTNKN